MSKPYYEQLTTMETIVIKNILKQMKYKSKIGIFNHKYQAKAYDDFGNELLIVKRKTAKCTKISLTPSLYNNWSTWQDIAIITNKIRPCSTIIATTVLLNDIISAKKQKVKA